MIAAVFPGQGSQVPGMGKGLFDAFSEAKSIFARISDATSVDVQKLCFETDEDTLRQTQNAQLALYTCSVAAWAVLQANFNGDSLNTVAGHSVGEYAALAAAEVVSVEAGAKLVQSRGELMLKAGEVQPGAMTAIIGLSREDIEEICKEAGGVVVVANDNSPGQLVISGDSEGVLRANQLATERKAKIVSPLKVSGAFHSPLMEEPSKEMGKALRDVSFKAGTRRVYCNVTSEPVEDPSLWAGLLEAQLKNPVRWTESVEHMRRDGVQTFIECGVGAVLTGLLRRIDRDASGLKINDLESFQATISSLEGKTGA